MQYVQLQREWVYKMRHVIEPHALDRTPDDSLRYQSVMFALVRALDKVLTPPPPSLSILKFRQAGLFLIALCMYAALINAHLHG